MDLYGLALVNTAMSIQFHKTGEISYTAVQKLTSQGLFSVQLVN
jgi:hypothetical protein